MDFPMGLSQTIRISFGSLPFGKFRFLRLYTLSAGIVPVAVFIATGTEQIPQIVMGNDFLIGAKPTAETFILLLHVCRIEPISDRFEFGQFLGKRGNLRFQFSNQLICRIQRFLQFRFFLFLGNILFSSSFQLFIFGNFQCYLRGKQCRFCLDFLDRCNVNILLFDLFHFLF